MPFRILILSINFPPDLVGAAKYTGELASALAARGHEVEAVVAPPYYPAWQVAAPHTARRYTWDTAGGVRVLRCPLWVRPNLGGVGRLLHLASFAAASAPALWWRTARWRPHVVFVVTPTLLTLPAAALAARLSGARLWLHVQDLEIDAAFALGLLNGSAARSAALALESRLLRACDVVSTIAPTMTARLQAKRVPADRLHMLPNWVDGDAVRPLPDGGSMRAELGYGPSDVVALYAGSMGAKQGLSLVVEAAARLGGDSRLRFLLAGDGPERAALQQAAQGMANVRFAPLVPAERLNDLLNVADIHVLPQRADADGLMMPSKLGPMMVSGRPVVACAAAGSDIAQALEGCGAVTTPGSAEALADALRALVDAPERRQAWGDAARRRALALWCRKEALDSFERRLHSLFANTF